MRKWWMAGAVLLVLGSCWGCGVSGTAETPAVLETEALEKTDLSSEAATEVSGQETAEADETVSEPELTMGDGLEASRWCGRYFRKGNFSWQLAVEPESAFQKENLEISVLEKEGLGYSMIHRISLEYEPGTAEYEIWEPGGVKKESGLPDFFVEMNEDGSILLAGNPVMEGIYYPMEALEYPQAFERPLYESHLRGMSREELRLLRNQFFAVYGYPFEAEDLREYFESKPWYQALPSLAGKGNFYDSMFRGVEKRNIEAIQEAEDRYRDEDREEWRQTWEALPEAPYLEFLEEGGEISVTLTSGVDRGLYYEAQGVIGLPAAISAKEAAALEKGETVSVCLDELTGETGTLTAPGKKRDYLLTKWNGEGETVFDCSADYDWERDQFVLWKDSADTIMKPVYEGPVYVWKGAEAEWFQYFDMPGPQGRSEGQRITFDGDAVYSGNAPDFDEKGYLRALYFYGD